MALDSKQKELYSHVREELKKDHYTPIELNLKQKRIYCDIREELKKNFSGEEIPKFLNALKQDYLLCIAYD